MSAAAPPPSRSAAAALRAGLRTVWIVWRKELRDFSRDRRLFLMTLLLGPVIYPLLMLGMGKLSELRVSTQLEQPLHISIVGQQHAPSLVAHLASHGIHPRPPPAGGSAQGAPATPQAEQAEHAEQAAEAAIRAQQEEVALVIAPDYASDWAAGTPATVRLLFDSTRRHADIPVQRVEAALQAYAASTGALRLLARGVNPAITQAVGVERKDLATPEARRGLMVAVVMPLILLIFAFIGSAHVSMDTTAGERERQSLEPLLATPAPRAALVSGKMLAAATVGLSALALTLLAFKLSAHLAGDSVARMMDIGFPAIARMLLILLPLVLIGTATLTFLSAFAKSMKEAQAHMTWLLFLPMVPAYALMAYPLKDTQLWQYAVPFLAQNQMLAKVSRGDVPLPGQWAVYFASAFGLAAVLWLAAVWRYRQERLAVAS
ncbi:MAG: ABC transporter permease [Pseudomonadota bacterium]|nr:ABC transporter permease [Pseudomonadota bacterium]